MDLVQEILKGLEKPGKSRIGLAAALGRSPTTVTEMLKPEGKRRRIRADEVPVIREYLELSPVVPIVGSVGAGSEAHFYAEASDSPGDTVQAPEGASPDTVAVEIRGDSLGLAFNGWLAFYDDRQEPITEALYGRLCVISLDTGQVLIKIPRPARERGRFHLISNVGGEVITDAKVVWAARVIDMKPRG